MNRAELEAMGLTKEQVDNIIKINGNDIENAKATSKAEITNLQSENETLKNQVKERDKQIDGLKKSAGDNEELKKQIETLQAENKTKDEAHAAEIAQMKVDAAVEKALTESGALNVIAAKALLKLDDAKLEADGTIKGLDEQINTLKGAENSKFLFKTDENPDGQHQFTGFQGGTATNHPNANQATYEARLAEARKNNNMIEVISIKEEAAANGIQLF